MPIENPLPTAPNCLYNTLWHFKAFVVRLRLLKKGFYNGCNTNGRPEKAVQEN
jgi:hypothetical protein